MHPATLYSHSHDHFLLPFPSTTLLGTPAMSSEAGSTIFGFLGISKEGKFQSEAGALKILTPPVWKWGSEIRGTHTPGPKSQGLGLKVFP